MFCQKNLSPDGSFRCTTVRFDLSSYKTVPANLVKDGRSSVNLTNGQASKYFFPLAKTDQVRETFRPSCRGKLLTEESPFYSFEATLTGFHTVRRVILHLSYFHQQSKITVYKQIYGKNSKRCTCILNNERKEEKISYALWVFFLNCCRFFSVCVHLCLTKGCENINCYRDLFK